VKDHAFREEISALFKETHKTSGVGALGTLLAGLLLQRVQKESRSSAELYLSTIATAACIASACAPCRLMRLQSH